MSNAAERIQQAAQSTTGRSMDGVAFLGGIAVWQDWVPTAVGIVTIVWFSTQIILSLPRLIVVFKQFFSWLTNKESK